MNNIRILHANSYRVFGCMDKLAETIRIHPKKHQPARFNTIKEQFPASKAHKLGIVDTSIRHRSTWGKIPKARFHQSDHDTLRDRRQGDPQHECCGKKNNPDLYFFNHPWQRGGFS